MTDVNTPTPTPEIPVDEARALRLKSARKLILDAAGGKLTDPAEINRRAAECGIDVDAIPGLVKNYKDRAKALLAIKQAEAAEAEAAVTQESFNRMKETRDGLVADHDKKLASCDKSMAAAKKTINARAKEAASLRAAGEKVLQRTDDPETVAKWEDLDARRKEIVAAIDAARERESDAITARMVLSDWALGVKIPTGVYPSWHPSAGDAIPTTPTPQLSNVEAWACEDNVAAMEADGNAATEEIVGLQSDLAAVVTEIDATERMLADPLGFAILT